MAGSGLPLLVALGGVLGAAGFGLQQSFLRRDDDGAAGCAALANKGTHFTIDVEVGTPSQRFSVVADTGSNSLIVPSCLCQQKGKCDTADRCFTGTNKSSTFHLELTEEKEPVSMVLSFGSGQIQAVVAQEKVRVGEVERKLNDGLLLMVDRALNIKGSFEGILGLGLPQLPTNWTLVAEQEKEQQEAAASMPHGGSIEEIIQHIIQQAQGGGGAAAAAAAATKAPQMPENTRKILQGALGNKEISTASGDSNLTRAKGSPHRDSPKGFLEQAGIGRFSMCFNDGKDGVLRIGEPPLQKSHGGMGTQHWGVDFRGVSVGGMGLNASEADVLFCRSENMSADQASPCGAIPDSGTTLMMGPKEHVNKLLAGICDAWPRCSKNYTKLVEAENAAGRAMASGWGRNIFNMENALSKADLLQLILQDCETWSSGSLDKDMPNIHFHIRGTGNTTQKLTIPPHMYVMEVAGEEVESSLKLLQGVGNIPADANITRTASRACIPAFGTMDYNTKSNGPVWILGTPLFYEYVVGYDMDTKPPSMNFVSQKFRGCGSCGGTVELASREGRRRIDADVDVTAKRPRRVSGPMRVPRIDTTKPL